MRRCLRVTVGNLSRQQGARSTGRLRGFGAQSTRGDSMVRHTALGFTPLCSSTQTIPSVCSAKWFC